MSPFDDSASAVANLGTSDHVSVRFTMHVTTLLEKQPAVLPVRDWAHAPWNHIRGAVKRALSYWDPSGCSSVDVAVDSLNYSLMCILDRYVPNATMPGLPGPSPWWNYRRMKALKFKQKAFEARVEFPDKYKKAVRFATFVQGLPEEAEEKVGQHDKC